MYLVVRVSRFERDYQLPVGLLIVEDEFFDLHRVGCQQKQEGSLKVCFWTVWLFEKLVGFGSVQWSEAFAGSSKLLWLFQAGPAWSRTCLVESIGCQFAASIGIFLMDGLAFKESWHAVNWRFDGGYFIGQAMSCLREFAWWFCRSESSSQNERKLMNKGPNEYWNHPRSQSIKCRDASDVLDSGVIVSCWLIVEDEFFDLHRVGCQQKQEGSLKVCFWTVWPFEKFVDFGSVKRSEAFASCNKLLWLFQPSPAPSRTCLGGFDWLLICPRFRNFLDGRLCLQNLWHAISWRPGGGNFIGQAFGWYLEFAWWLCRYESSNRKEWRYWRRIQMKIEITRENN